MNLKRFAAAALALVMTVSAAAGCAKKENDPDEKKTRKTEILTGVYRGTVYPLPEGFSAESSDSAWYDPATDTVLCLASSYAEDEETGEYKFRSSVFTLGTEGVKEETRLDLGDNAYVNGAVNTDGGILLLVQTWDDQSGESGWELIRQGENGQESVGDLAQFFPSVGGDWFNIGHMCADTEGNIYLSSDQEIAVLKPDMTLLRTVTCPSWINGMNASPDGTVYVSGWFDGIMGMGIAPIDLNAGEIGTPVELPNADSFFFAPGFDLYAVTRTGISGLTKGENGYESEMLMDFVNSSIDPDEVSVLGVVDRETFLFAERTDPEDWTMSPTVYRHAEDVDLSAVTVIELAYGSSDMNYSVPARVVAFNKAHPDMRIVVEDYSRYAANDDWEGGMTRLATDMATGVYHPDIVVGRPENADLGLLREKKLYADLYPYMRKDDVLTPDNLFASVLSACSDGDAVWTFCPTFSLQTLLSTKQMLGQYAGGESWTLAEFLDFAGSLPKGVELFEGLCGDNASILLGGNYGAFIDRENAVCSFDGEDFVRWLEFLVSLPKTWEEYAASSEIEKVEWDERYQFYHQGKIALKDKSFGDLSDFISLEMEFGTKDYVMIGYPAAREGESGLWIRTDTAYAVTSWCENPDAAWLALKSFCDGSSDRWLNGVPSLKSRFDEAAAEYETYEFAFYFDGSASWGTVDPEHPMTEDDLEGPGILTYFTKDDAARIKTILDRPAKLLGGSENDEITAIVAEEISSLTAGVSSPADCAKKIQSRVSIWLAEHK